MKIQLSIALFLIVIRNTDTASPKDPKHDELEDENSHTIESNAREENHNHAENPEESFEENERNIYDKKHDEEKEEEEGQKLTPSRNPSEL